MDGGSRYMFHRQGAAGNITGPWFPDSTGGYCARGSTGAWLVSGHTFRITAARTLSLWGLDLVTIQLLGRWGSMAVLSYLAESPLIGFADRLRDSTSSSSLSGTALSSVSLMDCVAASAMPSSHD